MEIDHIEKQYDLRGDRVILDLPDGVPPLTSLYLYIAGSCNLACRHCWITPRFVNGVLGSLAERQNEIQQALKNAIAKKSLPTEEHKG